VRREPLYPGAQHTIDDLDGCRFTPVLTDQTEVDVAVERRHRAPARAEDRIRALNQLGMANLPCGEFVRNAAWLQLTLVALNLLAWTQALTMDGELARAEPKRVRYQLAHTAARVTRSARRTTLRLAADWRWTPDLLAAFAGCAPCHQLPPDPTRRCRSPPDTPCGHPPPTRRAQPSPPTPPTRSHPRPERPHQAPAAA
jgi:hypothetical protein